MKKLSLSLLAVLILSASRAQQINLPLKQELDSILFKDQLFREYFSTTLDSIRMDSISRVFNIPRNNFFNGLSKLMNETDSSNLRRIEAIIAQYGYPGKALVGEKTNEAVFYVIQHSTKIDQYLPLIEGAATKNELPFYLYAMMKDRSLMYNNKPQIWGSQAKGMGVPNKTTGKSDWKFFIWPIEDAAHVNERRKKAGFTQTVEENAKRLGIDYKVITMEQVKNGDVN